MSLIRFRVYNIPGPITEPRLKMEGEESFLTEYFKYGKMTRYDNVTEISLLSSNEMKKFRREVEENEGNLHEDKTMDEIHIPSKDVQSNYQDFTNIINDFRSFSLRQNSNERNGPDLPSCMPCSQSDIVVEKGEASVSSSKKLHSYNSINIDEILQKSFDERKLYNIFFDLYYKRNKYSRLTVVLDSECPRAHDFYKVVCHDLLEYSSLRFGDLFIVSKRIKEDSDLCLAYSIFKNFLQLYIFPKDAIPNHHISLGSIYSDKIIQWTRYPHQFSKNLPLVIAAVGVKIGDQTVPHINLPEREEQTVKLESELYPEQPGQYVYGQQQYAYGQQQTYYAYGLSRYANEHEQIEQFAHQQQIKQYAYKQDPEQNFYEQNNEQGTYEQNAYKYNLVQNNYEQNLIQITCEQNIMQNIFDQNSEQNAHDQSPEQNAHDQSPEQNAHDQSPEQNAHDQNPEQNAHDQNPEQSAYKKNPEQNAYEQNPEQIAYKQNSEQNVYEQNPEQNAYEQNPEQNTCEQNHDQNTCEQNHDQNTYEQNLDQNTYEQNREQNVYEQNPGQYTYNPEKYVYDQNSGQYGYKQPGQYGYKQPGQYEYVHSGQYEYVHSGQYPYVHSGQYPYVHSGQYPYVHSGQIPYKYYAYDQYSGQYTYGQYPNQFASEQHQPELYSNYQQYHPEIRTYAPLPYQAHEEKSIRIPLVYEQQQIHVPQINGPQAISEN